MLHELLFALNGYPGTIFVEKEGTFSVVKGLPFLHPSETTILDKLCALGYHVKYLRNFIATYHSFSTGGCNVFCLLHLLVTLNYFERFVEVDKVWCRC
ncbi:hypothetical protein V5799_013829 [Amblyomma americanum]|uniref:Gamma tubulin complex component protein N-terminal domain-containing protein n=1 Tax=Amblyomma americanum TaxID=6943 RepID=A0AAQ4E4S4_AMBAM